MARVVSICLDNQKGVKAEPIIEGIFKYEFGLFRYHPAHESVSEMTLPRVY